MGNNENSLPLDKLLKISNNRYVLAIVAAKYARNLTEKASTLLLDDKEKPVTRAFKEISLGRVSFVPPGRVNK